jgi:5-formyltetrahydrofolate cyclo-ligase
MSIKMPRGRPGATREQCDRKAPQMKRDFDSTPGTEKEELRRALRRDLRALSPAFRAEASLVICELAARLPAFRTGVCIGLFAPLASEPDIHPLIEEAWAEGKTVLFPRMWKEDSVPRLEWYKVSQWGEVTEPGPFGLREPDPAQCPRIDPARLDCIFVPGMAFDQTGLRLGRGGGYYDHFLSQVPGEIARFGLMFAQQQAAQLPREPHDQALPAIVTEDGVLSFAASPSTTAVRSIQPPPSTSSPR